MAADLILTCKETETFLTLALEEFHVLALVPVSQTGCRERREWWGREVSSPHVVHSVLITEKKKLNVFRWRSLFYRLQHNTMMAVAPFLTHILVGVPSVRGHIDEEDGLACVLTEVHSVTPVQSLCLVFVNGAICGWVTLQGKGDGSKQVICLSRSTHSAVFF